VLSLTRWNRLWTIRIRHRGRRDALQLGERVSPCVSTSSGRDVGAGGPAAREQLDAQVQVSFPSVRFRPLEISFLYLRCAYHHLLVPCARTDACTSTASSEHGHLSSAPIRRSRVPTGLTSHPSQHPEIMPIHGFTTSIGTNPGPLVPLFTFAKTTIHSDILVTPLEQYSDTYIGYDPDFKKKKYNKLLWRGSTTGVDFVETVDWESSQRSRLHFETHEVTGKKTVLMAEDEGEMREMELGVKSMNNAYMDVSFSGSPVQCDPITCAVMRKKINFQPTMGLDESYQVGSSPQLCGMRR
jgi:hypothetical protein